LRSLVVLFSRIYFLINFYLIIYCKKISVILVDNFLSYFFFIKIIFNRVDYLWFNSFLFFFISTRVINSFDQINLILLLILLKSLVILTTTNDFFYYSFCNFFYHTMYQNRWIFTSQNLCEKCEKYVKNLKKAKNLWKMWKNKYIQFN